MLFLWILLGIVLLLVGISLLWVGVEIRYDSEITAPGTVDAKEDPVGVRVWLKIGFLRFLLFPKAPKTPSLRQYKIQNFRRFRRKLLKKEREQERKKTAASDEKKKTEEVKAPKKPLSQRLQSVWTLIREVVLAVLKKAGGYLRLDVTRIRIRIATEDAAKTATLYGAVCAGVADLLTFLSETCHISKKPKEEISVVPDFGSESAEYHIHLGFRMRIWHLISLALTALIQYVKIH